MKTLPRLELERRIKESPPEPLHLLVGCETYLRDAAVRKLTDAALAGTLLREFNETSFSLFADSSSEAVAAAEQLPMMSDRRVVKIRHFSKLREVDEEVLIRYVNNPAPSTVVIFSADDLHKGKRLSKALLDTCVVTEFPALRDGEAKDWVKTRLKSLKAGIDEPALNLLVTLAGTDVQTLNSELEKLAAAAIGQGHITRDLVDALVGRSRELSNFDLGDQLVAGDRRRALETLYRLLENDVPEVLLLGLIASNYHRLAMAKELLNRGARAEVERMVPSFKRNQFLAMVQKSSREKLAAGIKKIAAADLAIKTSQATPRLQLELLVCELAGN
ncbi:MAG TPA: DNA polymerase III subunit delta [Pyrinomonadaceae bacterium]|nr:DNA polymerase III subunit delta [Pyrinomonadaceae bacterium]